MDNGIDAVRARVGVESMGKPFDAINASERCLDSENLNPMVNMGAIAMCTLIHGDSHEDKFQRVLALIRSLAGNISIGLDEAVYLSEKGMEARIDPLRICLSLMAF